MIYGSISGIKKKVSRLVQGTMMIKKFENRNFMLLLDSIYKLGCTTFDTAHAYSQGEGERVLGQWINENGIRDNVVIITKGAHHNKDRKRVTSFDITSDLYDSLARLKTEYIDLYLLHRDDTSVEVGPIIEALNEHVSSGLIKSFGASNWTHERILKANQYAKHKGLIPFVSSSPNYCLVEQFQEFSPGCVSISGKNGSEARDWYTTEQLALFSWSSLAHGFLSGRFSRENLAEFTDSVDLDCIRTYAHNSNFEILDRIRILSTKRGMSIPQIALAYLFNRQPLNLFAIVGCYNDKEFKDNIEALTLTLSSEEMDWLESPTNTTK